MEQLETQIFDKEEPRNGGAREVKVFLFCFVFMFILRESKQGRGRERETERQRERESQAGSVLSAQSPKRGSNP